MSNVDPILFWLEQESVTSNADIYLPADTPTYKPPSRILYQIEKKAKLRKRRTIERLKAYCFENLEELRRNYSKRIDVLKLPSREITIRRAELVQNDDYLKRIGSEMTDLSNVSRNGNLNEQIKDSLENKDSEENIEKQKYKEQIEINYSTKQKKLLDEYDHLLEKIQKEDYRMLTQSN
ncbi:uncharacterized protein BX663DRAFT_554089 [Cokeromyces recurvatus]|uniref:uncharacterized protein n=1 Tax=Cokeromyces recurvatus TaxID=90255 RepID=UPI00221E82BF|nr:uncharacterized protein BX663DRAFT_554089 [Cokeromyces recurvatus]KAI7900490.1 hypothetical protein BX663DRAFT_554089 [Cokeromyces recurvatus]